MFAGPAALGGAVPTNDQDQAVMTDQTQDKRRSNIRLAIVLGLVAVGFYVAFVLVNMPGAGT